MPVLPPRRPPAPMRTLHCDTTLARPPTLLSPVFPVPTRHFLALHFRTSALRDTGNCNSLHPCNPRRTLSTSSASTTAPRCRRVTRPVLSVPSPPPRPRHDRTPTHRAPILSPRTTPRTSLCSTTVLALDHARLSRPPSFDHRPRPRPRHDRTTAPPLSSPPPPSSRSAPRHPFYGPVPRPRDARSRSRPDATTRAPVTTRALQRHAAPDHRAAGHCRDRRDGHRDVQEVLPRHVLRVR